jgi:hypothetical protein
MKPGCYKPTFNARVFGAAEKRADRYWKKRKEDMERGHLKDERLCGMVLQREAVEKTS